MYDEIDIITNILIYDEIDIIIGSLVCGTDVVIDSFVFEIDNINNRLCVELTVMTALCLKLTSCLPLTQSQSAQCFVVHRLV